MAGNDRHPNFQAFKSKISIVCDALKTARFIFIKSNKIQFFGRNEVLFKCFCKDLDLKVLEKC